MKTECTLPRFTAREIAAGTGLSLSGAYRAIRELEQKRYIVRAVGPDRPAQYVMNLGKIEEISRTGGAH